MRGIIGEFTQAGTRGLPKERGKKRTAPRQRGRMAVSKCKMKPTTELGNGLVVNRWRPQENPKLRGTSSTLQCTAWKLGKWSPLGESAGGRLRKRLLTGLIVHLSAGTAAQVSLHSMANKVRRLAISMRLTCANRRAREEDGNGRGNLALEVQRFKSRCTRGGTAGGKAPDLLLWSVDPDLLTEKIAPVDRNIPSATTLVK